VKNKQFQSVKIFAKIIISLLVIINILFFYLMFDGETRYNASRFTAELNDVYTKIKLRQTTGRRGFSDSTLLLNKQLDFVQSVSPGNNQLMNRLLDNIQYSFDTALDEDDKDHFEPLFRKMVDLYPDIYSLRVWYADTLQNNDSLEELFITVDEGINILGSDPRIYRIGIDAAFSSNNVKKLQTYCKQYNLNQFGGKGVKGVELAANRITGIGLRYLMLEIQNDREKIIIENAGLDLSAERDYEFLLPQKVDVEESLKLYFPVMPGVKVHLNSLSFFNSGVKQSEYENNEMFFVAKNSYVDHDNSVILSSNSGYEVIEIFLGSSQLIVDKIILNAGFSRLSSVSKNICKQDYVLE
jgi:hypothetical protein